MNYKEIIENLNTEPIKYKDDMGNLYVEEFRDIKKYEGAYQVSNLGRIKSIGRIVIKKNGVPNPISEKILLVCKSQKYTTVVLSKKGNIKPVRVHNLVAVAFLGHTANDRKVVVDHINNIKHDNRSCNLQIISQRHNSSKDKTSKYIGVSKNNDYFTACIRIDKHQTFLCSSKDALIASKHYQVALQNLEKYTGCDKTFRNLIKNLV